MEHDEQDLLNRSAGIGGTLDWESPLDEISLLVELPFWLLMPSHTLEVPISGGKVKVVVQNDGIEIQQGIQYTKTQQNTVFVGGEEAARNAKLSVLNLTKGSLFRATRTLLYIEAFAFRDAGDAFFSSDGPRFQDGFRYFASLAAAHLEVVNKVINAYRSASVDPFANEITEWDVPVWFVCKGEEVRPVCLYSTVVADWYPTVGDWPDGESRPYYATSTELVEKQLTEELLPGEIELLDGWSLFHRGRFGDSIRSFVTAIEVLVEAEIRRILQSQDIPEAELEARIDATRNNFDERLADYCQLSGRRIPGPVLHPVPYINGCRLHEEITITRNLRHRIVHHGHRLDRSFRGPMLRAAETTSWLFDWLAVHGDFEERRRVNHTYFFGLRISATPFQSSIKDGRIVLHPLFAPRPDQLSETDSNTDVSEEEVLVVGKFGEVVHTAEMLLSTISPANKGEKDVEHFVKMCFFELGIGEIEDSPYSTEEFPIPDRFRIQVGDKELVWFLLDDSEQISIDRVQHVVDSLDSLASRGNKFDRAILVSNDQMDLPLYRRASELPPDIAELADSRGITVIRTPHLAKLVLGAIEFNWSRSAMVEHMLGQTYLSEAPPNSVLLGKTYKFWPQTKVLGVKLEDEIIVRTGQLIAISLKDRFVQHELSEFEIDDERRLTFRIDMMPSSLPRESMVFLLDSERSFGPPKTEEGEDYASLSAAYAHKAPHPSEFL